MAVKFTFGFGLKSLESLTEEKKRLAGNESRRGDLSYITMRKGIRPASQLKRESGGSKMEM